MNSIENATNIDNRAKALLIIAQKVNGFAFDTDAYRPSEPFMSAFSQLQPDLMSCEDHDGVLVYLCTDAGKAVDTSAWLDGVSRKDFLRENACYPLSAPYAPEVSV